MKHQPLPLVFALVALPLGLAAVESGDTREAVIAELGAPTGSAAIGSNTILFFARGEVTLRDNRVVTANVISAEELAKREAEQAAALQRMDEAAKARLARLETEGRAIYAAKKVDSPFAALPVIEQLNYWRAFATRYPMIAVAAEIAPLAERVEHELRMRELAAASEERLAEIEARVENAEERAARAEREARRDRYGYPVGYPVHRPWPHGGGHNAPPRRDPVPVATPVLNPVDAARAEAMAETEAARRRAYNGGVDEQAPEPEPEPPVRVHRQSR
jgi:hypothetical protein